MYKDFEKDYNAEKELEARYAEADRNNAEDDKEKVRSDYKVFSQTITDKGSDYIQIFRLYKEARDRGNDYIDINDVVRNAEELIANFRKFGIKKFTYSSTWSSAVETAWEFTKSGCKLEGITEINSHCKEFMSDEYKKAPAYIFSLA